MTKVYFEDVEIGQAIPTLTKNASRQQLVMWAGASGEFDQYHFDDTFARDYGFPGVIIHGTLKYAFLGQLLHEWTGDVRALTRWNCQFREMDFPEQDIHCKGIITKKYQQDGRNLVDLDIWIENKGGQKTTPGTATVALPSKVG
jgi:acyl dehydratase